VSDLIERLCATGDALCLEAADEIQRLRQALVDIQSHAVQHPMAYVVDIAREALEKDE
jgi:hypothetical protein